MSLRVQAPYEPAGDQGPAIEALSKGLADGARFQTLRGVTGVGKTFIMAKLIEAADKPALILCHNKTLAAQLYEEMRAFFPDAAVEYFVSCAATTTSPRRTSPAATPTSPRNRT